ISTSTTGLPSRSSWHFRHLLKMHQGVVYTVICAPVEVAITMQLSFTHLLSWRGLRLLQHRSPGFASLSGPYALSDAASRAEVPAKCSRTSAASPDRIP